MSKQTNSLLLGLLISLVSCGGGDKPSDGAPAAKGSHNTGIISESPAQAYNVIKNRPYISSKLDKIPEASALLMFSVQQKDGSFSAHQCSSSLIAPDVILTNSHCIPDQIKYDRRGKLRKNYSCKSWIVAHFPDNDTVKENQVGKFEFKSSHIDCETVVFASDNDAKDRGGFSYNQDYAVIKLAKPAANRKVLDIAYDGISADQKLFTYSYDPIQGGGDFKKKECLSIEKSQQLSTSEYPIGRTILMADCTVIKGNSGSPVVDESGILRGALWGGPGDPAGLKSNYKPRPDMTDFTYVTSASCMNVPGYIAAPPHVNCDGPVNGLAGPGPEDFFNADFDGTEVETSSTLPITKFFKYIVSKERPLNGPFKKLGLPVCISDPDGLQEYLATTQNSLLGKFDLTNFAMNKWYNRYLQERYELAPSSMMGGMFYSLTRFSNPGEDLVYGMALREDNDQAAEIFKFKLETCE